MFLRGDQIFPSWAVGRDFAIVLDEMVRVSADRLLMGGPKDAPLARKRARRSRPGYAWVRFRPNIDRGRKEGTRRSRPRIGGISGFLEIPDSNYAPPTPPCCRERAIRRRGNLYSYRANGASAT